MCFSPNLGVCGGGGGTKGSRAHNLLMQFSGLGNSKMEISETDFFDTLTIQNDQISYVKHVLDPLHVFFTLFGCGGGGGVPRGLGHTTCLCSFPASAAQKWKFSETDFFDTLTIQNDQISYVKHVLDPLHVFFTLFGCGGGGGGTKGSRAHNLLMQFSGLSNSKMEISETDFFDTLTIQNDQISYVKHVLDPVHVFFTLFGCGGGGGGVPRGLGHTTCLCSFQASATQK